MQKIRTALSIAGSDCSGGAGIQADLKTMTVHGVYGMSVITALTAQNTMGVYAVHRVTEDFLRQQMDCIFTDITPDAVKVGMTVSGGLIRVIAEQLACYHAKNIVLDPVMISTSGTVLLDEDAREDLTNLLFPMARLVTPNLPEAEVLAGRRLEAEKEIASAAVEIGCRYGCSVLLKGGHRKECADDFLYDREEDREIWITGMRYQVCNTHGTGCTLSSAIASNLAKGNSLEESVRLAKNYMNGALQSGMNLGKGNGPLNHMWQFPDTEDRKIGMGEMEHDRKCGEFGCLDTDVSKTE